MISFVIPVFKDVRFLDRAIESINKQTREFGNLHVIIVDDSHDNDQTFNKIRNIIIPYVNLLGFSVISTNDIGSSRARNLASQASSGKYIVFLDPDDYIHQDYLRELMPILHSEPDYAFAYPNTLYTDGQSYRSVPSPDYSFFQLMAANYIPYCSLIRKEAFDKTGFDSTNFNYWEDYQLWINMGANGFYGKHVAKDLFFYTVRTDSSSASLRAQQLPELYKAYIIYRNPYIFPLEWQQKAKEIVASYPEGFMSWKPFEQENYLKERNQQ